MKKVKRLHKWEIESESGYTALKTFRLVPISHLSYPRATLPLRSRILHNTSNGCHHLDTAGKVEVTPPTLSAPLNRSPHHGMWGRGSPGSWWPSASSEAAGPPPCTARPGGLPLRGAPAGAPAAWRPGCPERGGGLQRRRQCTECPRPRLERGDSKPLGGGRWGNFSRSVREGNTHVQEGTEDPASHLCRD